MDFISTHLLTSILFIPVIAALIILFIPSDQVKAIRWTALLASLIPFGLTLWMWFRFDPSVAGFQYQEQYPWYEAIHSTFHIGVDGLSLAMVLLTTLLTPLALLASFGITEKVKAYMMLFLFLEAGMLGVFLAMDLLIFFVFWEIGLVPMYFLINQWGSPKGERKLWGGMTISARNYASMKFMIYTMAGSLGLLLAIQLLGVLFQNYDLAYLYKSWNALPADGIMMGMSVATVKAVAFWAFVIEIGRAHV